MSLTWSTTRARTLEQCARRYWYRYHLAPRGREPDAPPEAREAHVVKDLVGLDAWCGDLVHRIIERALNAWRGGHAFTEAMALDQARKGLSREYRDSRAYWTADPEDFQRRPILLDCHYLHDHQVDRDRAAQIRERVLKSIRSFYHCPVTEALRSVGPAAWLPIDRNAAAHLELEGETITILVKPDFAFRDGSRIHILDWKTGRADSTWEQVQLVAYRLYAERQWAGTPGRICARAIYLYPEYVEREEEPGIESYVRQIIVDSLDQMQRHTGLDEPPDREHFPCTQDAGRCRWCNFRGLCEGSGRTPTACR